MASELTRFKFCWLFCLERESVPDTHSELKRYIG